MSWKSITFDLFFLLLQHIASLIGAIILAVISQVLTPPVKLPDLYTLLITTYSFVHFAAFLLYFHYLQFTTWRGLAASARFCWINLDDHVGIWVWFIPSFLVAFSFCIDALLFLCTFHKRLDCFSQSFIWKQKQQKTQQRKQPQQKLGKSKTASVLKKNKIWV